MPLLQTTTLSNQNIASALLVGTYTANAERSALTCTVLAKDVAGNGVYTVYATRQLAGAGVAYEYQSRATALVESGVTSIAFPSLVIPVSNTDVVKVYLIGLAGDTTTPDIICEFWDLGYAMAVDLATVDTVVDAIKAKTDNLPTDPADQSAIEAAIISATSPLATAAALVVVDDFLDTEIAAIKAKTDNLPTDPADQSLLEASITAATSSLATAAALAVVDDFLDTEIAAIKAKTDNLPTDPADQSLLEAAIAAIPSAPTAAVIADAVWDEALSGHVTVGTTGKKLTDLSNADLSSLATAVDLATVDTVVDAIKAKTDNLPTDPADQSLLEAAIAAIPSAPSAAVVADAVWDEALSGHVTVGTTGKKLTDLSNADLSSLATAANLATVDTVVDAIKAKTDNLPTDPADESLLEAAIAAIPSAPSAVVVADAVWDEALSGHVTVGTTGKKLADLSSGGSGGTTAEEIDALLSNTHGAGSWGAGGVGAVSHTITVNSGGSPLDGVDVWVTTDVSGSNVAARGITNAFGQVTFFLDTGTYYGWKQLNGYTFTNPTEFTVA